MRRLRTIIQDVSEGRNLEVYLTILVAVVLSILGLFNIVDTEIVATVTLATLALIAISTISSREQIASLQDQIRTLTKEVEDRVLGHIRAANFFNKQVPNYESDFHLASTIFIVGTTLSRTVRNYLSVFESRLRQGATIRLVIIDPESDAVKQAALRSYGVSSDDFYPNRIKPTLDLLQLLASLPDQSGSLELALLPYMPSFGLILIDADQPHGKMHVEIYQHKSVDPNPSFELQKTNDDYWYGFFRNQFDALWDSSRVVNLSAEEL